MLGVLVPLAAREWVGVNPAGSEGGSTEFGTRLP